MNKRELAKAVAVHADVDLKTVSSVLEGFTEVVTAVVAQGEPVAISGFAKFVKVNRPARMGRNPATGEAIRIKASKKARITPVKAFKDAVMSPTGAPKLRPRFVPDQRRRRACRGQDGSSGRGAWTHRRAGPQDGCPQDDRSQDDGAQDDAQGPCQARPGSQDDRSQVGGPQDDRSQDDRPQDDASSLTTTTGAACPDQRLFRESLTGPARPGAGPCG